MAVQMLYQRESGGSSLEEIFANFNLEDYLVETESPPEEGEEDAPEPPKKAIAPALRKKVEASFEYARRLVEGVHGYGDSIDELIKRQAENWRLERMPAIDRSILRLALYEMEHEDEVPKVVIVDEAIELAKKFGSENSGRFVNGLLDGILKSRSREGASG